MNDITYTFNQTSKERKALVPSAMKRTNGSKSRKCTLPSDLLTPAQQRKLNGPVYRYNLTCPMDWETFKTMPLDLQAEYLSAIHSRFGIGVSRISTDLFHLSDMAVSQHCKQHGIHYPTKKGRPSRDEIRDFRAWAKGENPEHLGLLTYTAEPEKPVITEPEKTVEPVSSVEPDIPTTRNTITLASLRMTGTAEDVLATLQNFLTCEGRIELEVTINFKEENKH